MVRYIEENYAYNDTGGDSESPTGWFGLAGRWIVTVDSFGFVYGTRHIDRRSARDAFAFLLDEYSDWSDADGPADGY